MQCVSRDAASGAAEIACLIRPRRSLPRPKTGDRVVYIGKSIKVLPKRQRSDASAIVSDAKSRAAALFPLCV